MTSPNPNADATSSPPTCALCARSEGVPIWHDLDWHVIRVDDPRFPAFYRVIAALHVVELTDLNIAARQRCMELVCAVEAVLRQLLKPTKINLAALGNMVPHLHWHIVARFDWDSHFPEPIWGARQRDVEPAAVQRLDCDLPTLDAAVAQALARC